jgi:HK97 family phage major capsid protein
MPPEVQPKTKEITETELKAIIAQETETVIMAKGFVKLGDLKAEVESAVATVVTKELKPTLDAELKKLQNLPGPGGKDEKFSDSAMKGLSPTGNYRGLSEFAKDVYLATPQVNLRPSEKLTKWKADVDAISEVLKVAGTPTLEISDPESGGILIPPEYSTALMTAAWENSNFASLCTPIPLQRNSVKLPYVQDFDHTTYLFGALAVYWADELGAKTPSKPKFGHTMLDLHKMIVLVYASDELLEDSPISLEPLLGMWSEKAIAWKLDQAIYRGTGAGCPQGVLKAAAKIAVAAGGGQAADTIIFENVVLMMTTMWSQGKQTCLWVVTDDALPQLSTMYIPMGAGGIPVWLPAGGISQKPYDTLYGKRVIYTEHASALGDEGDISLIDFSQYLLAQKQGYGGGVQFAKSIHLKFEYDQTAFRYVFRTDGRSWWPTYFTPNKGNPKSHIVTLAAR